MWRRRRKTERHRAAVVAHIPLDTTDELAALLAIEEDTLTRQALRAALDERRSVLLTLAHQQCWNIVPTSAIEDTGPNTSPMV